MSLPRHPARRRVLRSPCLNCPTRSRVQPSPYDGSSAPWQDEATGTECHQLNHSLEGRFKQGVDLHVPRPEAVRVARARPLVTAVLRPFWHGCGT